MTKTEIDRQTEREEQEAEERRKLRADSMRKRWLEMLRVDD